MHSYHTGANINANSRMKAWAGGSLQNPGGCSSEFRASKFPLVVPGVKTLEVRRVRERGFHEVDRGGSPTGIANTTHITLSLTDDGTLPLTRYRHPAKTLPLMES